MDQSWFCMDYTCVWIFECMVLTWWSIILHGLSMTTHLRVWLFECRMLRGLSMTTLWGAPALETSISCSRAPTLSLTISLNRRWFFLISYSHVFNSFCVWILQPVWINHINLFSDIYTTKIDGVVCPPNISETVAGRLMKLAHRQCIASTTIKLISTNYLLSILSILVKTIQRIFADPKRTLSPPFDSADSVSSLGHPAPGSGNMLPLFTVPCDYPVLVTEIGALGLGKTIQPIRM